MANIAIFEIFGWEKAHMKRALKGHKVTFFEGLITPENASKVKNCDILSVFIYSKVNKKVLEQLPKLKTIATRSTGFDHIDSAYCKRKKILIANVPTYGENTVAEHTFALILSLSRHVHKSYVRALRDDYSILGLTGFDLKEKTIGIVGGGHIGLHVARIARGFGMHVLVFDIHRQKFLSEIIGFHYATMDEIFKKSDILTLHVPYNKHTHHLINTKNIKQIKKGSILINTARGALVDTNALLYGLENHILGGAGLDVLEEEVAVLEEKQLLHDPDKSEKWKTLVMNQQILKMDNVVFTPHNAFNSREALERILDVTLENIGSCLEGSCKFQIE